MSIRNRVASWTLLLITLGLFVGSLSPVALAWNVTSSIPRGLYLTTKTTEATAVTYGDIVCFKFVEPSWAKGRMYVPQGLKICKPVVGLPGDALIVNASELLIQPAKQEGTRIPVPTVDSKGRHINPAVRESGVVPPGHVFLVSTYKPNSLDSRYLGAIPRESLTNKISPLWLLKD
jgi:conjugative transfer signal peptidase TraF